MTRDFVTPVTLHQNASVQVSDLTYAEYTNDAASEPGSINLFNPA
ncbi:MAG: hypothetical protein WBA77_19755 [Microcoleaceae cyanobacterium]